MKNKTAILLIIGFVIFYLITRRPGGGNQNPFQLSL